MSCFSYTMLSVGTCICRYLYVIYYSLLKDAYFMNGPLQFIRRTIHCGTVYFGVSPTYSNYSYRCFTTVADGVDEFNNKEGVGGEADWTNKSVVKAFNQLSKEMKANCDEGVINGLLNEASTEARIASYSAMDLSELFHSTCYIIIADEYKCNATQQSMQIFLDALCRQMVSRKHCLCVRNEFMGTTQALSIIGVSNILFSVRAMRTNQNILPLQMEKELLDMLFHVLRFYCDRDAVLACRPFHLNSILESLLKLSTFTTEDEWVVIKRFMKELHRKKEFMTVDETTYVHVLREVAIGKFYDTPLRRDIINKYLS